MPKSADFNEERMAKAFAAALREKKSNFSKIAREFDVSRETLLKRVKKAKSPPIPQDFAEKRPSCLPGESFDQLDS